MNDTIEKLVQQALNASKDEVAKLKIDHPLLNACIDQGLHESHSLIVEFEKKHLSHSLPITSERTFRCSVHGNRFDFLLPSLPTSWMVDNDLDVEKVMLWEDDSTQVWWESHDGLTDESPLESTETLEKCLARLDGTKKQFYVKPNLSPEKSREIIDLCSKRNVTIVRCMPWSMYPSMTYIHKNRTLLRTTKKNNTILFGGSITDDRKQLIERARCLPGFRVMSGVSSRRYIDAMTSASWSFQPNGVGPRHSIYESMALGVPNLIQENSFLHPVVADNNVTFDDVAKLNETKMKTSDELSKKCIACYELFMTPEAIVNDVLRKVS